MSGTDRTGSGSAAAWFKSRFCGPYRECVEVTEVNWVAMRHSRDPDGPVLWFTTEDWAAFLAGVRAGEFDHLC
ncbi:MAG: DUF397 domain-containing protein [Streptosporangiales bacterium]|nr:DUF397 domain-containing protein [Streptosporangiales bacterium]